MSTQLLEIQPRELQFVFELKKQLSCSVRLTNDTHNYVAFKVKTTSPKKYSVRPNVGVITPKSKCDFIVTMQAQREVPSDMTCKDKFLIQSTIVPVGTTDEDITASTFAKDDGRYVEENKLKVILVSPPHSPVMSPINGTLKQGPAYEEPMVKEPVFSISRFESFKPVAMSEECKSVNCENLKPIMDEDLKQVKDMVNGKDIKAMKDKELQLSNGVNDQELKPVKDVDSKPKELQLSNGVNDQELKPVKDVDSNPKEDVLDTGEVETAKNAVLTSLQGEDFKFVKAEEEQKLVKDIEEMKSKLNELESKLGEAGVTISRLTEERSASIQERKKLQEELALLRTKTVRKRVQVGFPFLFVCMVAFISVILGYLLRC
ncbi:hypothetical protein SLEP1_g17527 [Rubroshorea leprosula]|uniref:MSP domain-containing protein n=1 Tax=Rubroshorea leprosula TaxID=152421 RepID=A0AAV5IUN4_9ROSI|nr:hypothetical protein SLEP1_g17527 [Rubroshorea leprosula]